MKYLIFFNLIIFILLFASCGSYRISTTTLQNELQLENGSLRDNRLTDIPAKQMDNQQEYRNAIIKVDKNKQMSMVLNTVKDSSNSFSGNIYHSNYNKIWFYPGNAWASNDTLYYKKYCHYNGFEKVSFSNIQYAEVSFEDVKRKGKARKGIWLEPSPAQSIDGFSFSVATMPKFFFNVDTVAINGFNLGIEIQWVGGAMASVGLAGMSIGYLIAAPFYLTGKLFEKKEKHSEKNVKPFPNIMNPVIDTSQNISTNENNIHNDSLISLNSNIANESICTDKSKPLVMISGFNLGLLGSSWQDNIINGVNVCGIATISKEINGVSFTGGVTVLENQNGVAVSGLVNTTQTGKGLQISLVNYAKDFRGVQIGLWNQIGRIGIPFINMKFTKQILNEQNK